MQIDFEKMDGLAPAIVQENSTGEVLMVGFMNAESLAKTVETPIVTQPAPAPRGSIAKWVIIAVLVLGGAAGAWLYWNHQQGIAATTTSPAR